MSTNIEKIKLMEFSESELNSFEGIEAINKRISRTPQNDNQLKVKVEDTTLSYIAYHKFDYETDLQDFCVTNALFGTNKMKEVLSGWELILRKKDVTDEEIESYIRRTWVDGEKFVDEDIEAIKYGHVREDEFFKRYTPLENIQSLLNRLETLDVEKKCKELNDNIGMVFDFGLKDKNLFEKIISFYKTALEHKKSVLCVLYIDIE